MVTVFETYPAFVRTRFNFMASPAEAIIHAVVGLVGELGELRVADDRTNFIEELGDFEFYLEALKQVTNHAPYENAYYGTDCGAIFKSLYSITTALLDFAKKEWVYKKNVDPAHYHEGINHIETCLKGLYSLFNIDRAFCIAANIAKLEKRYPSGYSNAAAIARADKPKGE
jgi:hypothetical protein